MREITPLVRSIAAEIGVEAPWHLLDAASDISPAPWSDPIPIWASDQSGAIKTQIVARQGGRHTEEIVLDWEEQGLQVWHQPTVVVIPVPPGSVQLGVEYEWDRAIPFRSFVEFDQTAEGEILPTLDARFYIGERSVILEADSAPTTFSIPPAFRPRCCTTGCLVSAGCSASQIERVSLSAASREE